ncbi:MAG: HrgC protein [Brevinema sp.]
MVIFLQNKRTGQIKKGILGFSWTTFFFGLFVPLLRGDLKMFIPFFLFYIAGYYIIGSYFMPYTYSHIDGIFMFQMMDDFGIYSMFSSFFYFMVNIFGAFFYNKIYTQGLINRGFIPMSEESNVLLASKGIIF